MSSSPPKRLNLNRSVISVLSTASSISLPMCVSSSMMFSPCCGSTSAVSAKWLITTVAYIACIKPGGTAALMTLIPFLKDCRCK